MIDPHRQRGPLLHRRGTRRAELEAQKMHRRGFVGILPLQVFVGNGEYRLEARHPDPYTVLDPDQAGEPGAPFAKSSRLVVPIYGREQTERFLNLIGVRARSRVSARPRRRS